MRSTLLRLTVAFGALLLASGCAGHHDEKVAEAQAPARKTGDLSRTLDMVDKDGRVYGTVEMDPMGGGRVLDASGRVIGTIARPDR